MGDAPDAYFVSKVKSLLGDNPAAPEALYRELVLELECGDVLRGKALREAYARVKSSIDLKDPEGSALADRCSMALAFVNLAPEGDESGPRCVRTRARD